MQIGNAIAQLLSGLAVPQVPQPAPPPPQPAQPNLQALLDDDTDVDNTASPQPAPMSSQSLTQALQNRVAEARRSAKVRNLGPLGPSPALAGRGRKRSRAMSTREESPLQSSATPPKAKGKLWKLGKKGRVRCCPGRGTNMQIAVIPSHQVLQSLQSRISSLQDVDLLFAVCDELGCTISPPLYEKMSAEEVAGSVQDSIANRKETSQFPIEALADLHWLAYTTRDNGVSKIRFDEPLSQLSGEQIYGLLSFKYVFICPQDDMLDFELKEFCVTFIESYLRDWYEAAAQPLSSDTRIIETEDELADEDEDDNSVQILSENEEDDEDDDRELRKLELRVASAERRCNPTFIWGDETLELYAKRRGIELARLKLRQQALDDFNRHRAVEKKSLNDRTMKAVRAAAIEATRTALLEDEAIEERLVGLIEKAINRRRPTPRRRRPAVFHDAVSPERPRTPGPRPTQNSSGPVLSPHSPGRLRRQRRDHNS